MDFINDLLQFIFNDNPLTEFSKFFILWLFFALFEFTVRTIMLIEGINKCHNKGYGTATGVWLPLLFGVIGFLIIFLLPNRYADSKKIKGDTCNNSLVKNTECLKQTVNKMPALCPECKNPVRSNVCTNCGATNEYSFIKKDTDANT